MRQLRRQWIGRIVVSLLPLLLTAQQRTSPAPQEPPNLASLTVQATNAGRPLAAEDGRVYVYPIGKGAKLLTEGYLNTPLALPPGRYNLRVHFVRPRQAQTAVLRNLTLAPGQRLVQPVTFTAGELTVVAQAGTAPPPAGQVVVYVFQPNNHDRVLTAMRSGERVLLSAGNYDLRVVYKVEAEERDVRWFRNVSITAGQHTQRQVSFQRGVLLVQARNAGQALPSGAVTLTVYRADDAQQEVLDTGLADAPLDLAVGRYDVKATFTHATDKPVRWLRGLDLAADTTHQATVEFTSGSLIVNAAFKDGEAVGTYDVYVYYYRTGNHEQPVGYTPARIPAVLSEGHYDVRVHFFRSHDQPDIWVRGLVVRPGQATTHRVTFPSGKLLVRVYDAAGTELIGDTVFLYVYAANQRQRPLVSARSGELLILTADTYDIRAVDTRHPGREVWLSAVQLRAGKLTERSMVVGEEAPRSRQPR